jgi:hypothetical protein
LAISTSTDPSGSGTFSIPAWTNSTLHNARRSAVRRAGRARPGRCARQPRSPRRAVSGWWLAPAPCIKAIMANALYCVQGDSGSPGSVTAAYGGASVFSGKRRGISASRMNP